MTTFDRAYYDGIWGTVHRHDYTESLADWLIQTYGRGRILDIGTGCGHLVKMLRERGCDAWGVDISNYAVAMSCCPDYVRWGDIRDLPFASNRFDLVHSNGVWGYFPEADIPQAWAECQRVGKRQHHNIDYDDDIPEHQMLIVKPKAWWDAQFLPPKILVACPTYIGKEYCMAEWVAAVRALEYKNFDVLMVDNSADESFMRRWQDVVPMEHLTLDQDPQRWTWRICQSMQRIKERFMAGDYAYWFNVEADVIPPPNIIERMFHYGRDADWISQHYVTDKEPSMLEFGIGCSLLSRRLMAEFDWSTASDSPDAELWTWVQRERRHPTVEMWYANNVAHRRL